MNAATNSQVDPLDALARAPRFPRARNSDPSSSHDAAAMIERTGGADEQARQALAALRQFPGSTSAELAHFAKLDCYMVGRRLSEIAADNKIRRAEPNALTVPCRMSAKRVCRWYPL